MAKSPLGVLILHGFTANPDHLLELHACIQALGLPTRVPVLRGHGAPSPEALRGVSWCDWVADAEVALQALLTTSERAIIVGHSMGGNCQERCHPLEAFYASFAKATGRLVCWVANGSLIHTKSGSFQQRIDLLQRLGFAMRASS